MLVKLKYLFRERVEFTKNTSIPCYSVTKKGIIPQLDTIAKTRKIENRKIIYPNDYIFNSRSSRFGSSGLASSIGSVASVNLVIYPISSLITMDYMNYYFKSPLFIYQFYFLGKGIVDDLWSTHYEQLKELVLILPPLNQQLKKSSFLTLKCSLIQELFSKIDLLLKKFEEYQASLIYEKIYQNNFLKTSIKLKYLFSIQGGSTPSTNQLHYWNGSLLFIKPTDINPSQKYLVTTQSKITIEAVFDSSLKVSPKNSIIFSCRAPIGKINILLEPAYFSQGCKSLVLIDSSKYCLDFFYYYLKISVSYFEQLGLGSTFKELYPRQLGSFIMNVPSYSEQQSISFDLNSIVSILKNLKTYYLSLKAHLEEYHSSLLYETFQHLS